MSTKGIHSPAAFIPAESPPLVKTAIFFCLGAFCTCGGGGGVETDWSCSVMPSGSLGSGETAGESGMFVWVCCGLRCEEKKERGKKEIWIEMRWIEVRWENGSSKWEPAVKEKVWVGNDANTLENRVEYIIDYDSLCMFLHVCACYPPSYFYYSIASCYPSLHPPWYTCIVSYLPIHPPSSRIESPSLSAARLRRLNIPKKPKYISLYI